MVIISSLNSIKVSQPTLVIAHYSEMKTLRIIGDLVTPPQLK